MYVGKTPLAFCMTWALIVILHFSQGAEIESISQHSIDLNRQTYNRVQLERSQEREVNEEQTRKIVSIEVTRATSKIQDQEYQPPGE